MNLTELREIAERATPGPWETLDKGTVLFGPGNYVEMSGRRMWDLQWRCWAHVSAHEYLTKCDMPWVQFDPEETNRKDAEHIAAFNPQTVLLMIDVVDEANDVLASGEFCLAELADRLEALTKHLEGK